MRSLRGARRRALAQWEGLPQQLRRVVLGSLRRSAWLRQVENHHDSQPEEGEGNEAAHLIVSGVPTGMRAASRRIWALGIRMQPCEIRPGISSGSSVPWMPTNPPPGQSVSVVERAVVPNARGPYEGLA